MSKKAYGSNTVKKVCPHCGHDKAHLSKPKICSRCGKENKGFEMRKEKHKRTRLRAVR